jgi:geranylgeranyl pyrophosphate synthase
VVFGEPLAINAGTAAYFMGEQLLRRALVDPMDRLRLYDLYFEALRAGHAGQAIDLGGLDSAIPEAIEKGAAAKLEPRVLAIHRLKTAVPASALSRMGAVAGGGSKPQIEAVGAFFEAVGVAFQIIDDVLNLRGFKGNLKSRGEDISHGKVTMPVAKALAKLATRAERADLWTAIAAKPTDPVEIGRIIEQLEACGAVEACVTQATALVEEAWGRLDPLVEDSLAKVMLRGFGWFVLERHY